MVERLRIRFDSFGCEVVRRQVQTVLAFIEHRILARFKCEPQTAKIHRQLGVFVTAANPVTPDAGLLESNSLSIKEKLHRLSCCAAACALLRRKLRCIERTELVEMLAQVLPGECGNVRE